MAALHPHRVTSVSRGDMTLAGYLAFEEASDEKHEWIHGYVVAMAGGTPRNATLSSPSTRAAN